MPLDDLLKNQISEPTRKEITHKLLENSSSTINLQYDGLDWKPYFSYYTEECSLAIGSDQHLLAATHQNIIAITKEIESTKTKNEIRVILPPEFDKDLTPDEARQKMERAIRLAARLLLIIDIGPLPANAYSGRSPLLWNQRSLKDCMQQFFAPPPQKYSRELKLQPLFTGRNLVRMAGIEIAWTDNLTDHLLLIDGDQRVCIFHHASFLK
jgi:hypothetical protein